VTAIASRFFYYFLLLLFSLWFEKRQKTNNKYSLKYVTAVAIVVVLEIGWREAVVLELIIYSTVYDCVNIVIIIVYIVIIISSRE
jgi:hypothetical protein